LYHQLPEFGWLAYPVRAEATKHVLPGRKSPGCPAAVCAAVGTIWGARKLGGLNIKKYLPLRNRGPQEVVSSGSKAGSRPGSLRGRPMTQGKKQVYAHCGTAGVWDQTSKERYAEITSGRSGGQQGLVDNLQRLLQRGKTEVEESPLRLANESVGAIKEGQYPLRRRKERLPNGGHTNIGQRDSGYLAGPPSARWSGTEPAIKPLPRGGSRLWSNQMKTGRMCTST
jgi:hypothetical protein